MKQLRPFFLITAIVCIAITYFTGCKKKPIELTGELGQFVGIWECTERNLGVSSSSQFPVQDGFEHELIIRQNGNYNLNRQDGIDENGCIVMQDITDGEIFLTWIPNKKDEDFYFKKGTFRMYTFELNGKTILYIKGTHQNYEYEYEKA